MIKKYMSVGFEFKEVDDGGSFEGFASTFNNVDLGGDMVDVGAFKKTIRDSKGKVPVLADHSIHHQIGWGLEAKEQDDGLWVRGILDIQNNQKAKEKHSLAKKALEIGAKSGLSIGYTTIKAEPDKANPTVRRLKEVKLWEYSFVAFPMNPNAQLTLVKSFDGMGLSASIKDFLQTLINLGYDKKDIWESLKSEMPKEPVSFDHSLQGEIKKLISFLKTR